MITSQLLFTFVFTDAISLCFFLGGGGSGRVLDSRLRGGRFGPHRRQSIVSLSKNINPSLVLAQPRKTRPYIIERLLVAHKESNQTNKISLFSQKVVNVLFTFCSIYSKTASTINTDQDTGESDEDMEFAEQYSIVTDKPEITVEQIKHEPHYISH